MFITRYNGKLYIFEKNDINETRENFIQRCWFKIQYLEKNTSIEMEFLEQLSRIWLNKHLLELEYSCDIEKFLN